MKGPVVTVLTSRTRAARRVTVAAVVAALVTGLGALGAATPAAQAAEPTDSAVTIKWAGGNDTELQQYQPDRSHMVDNADGSGHWEDFNELEVTVSKTRALRDQVVTVNISGMAGTQKASDGLASNFVQAMQCWGDDPNADDFVETCQYGGFSQFAGARKSAELISKAVSADALARGYYANARVPFRTVWNEVNQPFESPGNGTFDGTSAFFTDATTNEEPFIPVRADRTGEFDFEVQSAASAPHLGCGDPAAAGERCWLVIVPRGVHTGGYGKPPVDGGQMCGRAGWQPPGTVTAAQFGSPIERGCSFWGNRIVVPLDFENPFQSCAVGSAERRLSGSELIAVAVSSWQPALCRSSTPATFSLTTNSGNLTRAQLLQGSVDFAVVAAPVTESTIGGADPALLDEADIRYAPLANTALTISFVATTQTGLVQYHDFRLTPRLVAKMLTQSYGSDVPWVFGLSGDPEHLGHRPWPVHVLSDPEWAAIGNPAFNAYGAPTYGSFVVSGGADDAIRLLWEYVLADADAVAFLRGESDPWGMTVNPYYLPPGHPQAKGGGLDLLTQPLDTFPRADQTQVPTDPSTYTKLNYKGQQIDSVTLLPYSSSLTANAQRIVRGDTQYTNEWDPGKMNSAGEQGAWAPLPPQNIALAQFIMGPTGYAASERYGLDAVALGLPSAERSTAETAGTARPFVAPSAASLSRALTAQADAGPDGVSRVDLGALPDDAYPLTTTVYGAVNRATLDDDAAIEYATLLDYVAGDGQVPGDAPGQLPAGYAPLDDAQRESARALAQLLRTGDPAPSPEPSAPGEGDAGGAAPDAAARPAGSVVDGDPAAEGRDPQTQVTASEAGGVATTAAVSAPGAAVGGALLAALAASVASPLLMRRRPSGG